MPYRSLAVHPPRTRPSAPSNRVVRTARPVRVLASAAVALLAACQGDSPLAPAPVANGRAAVANRAAPATDAQLSRELGTTPGVCFTAARASNGEYLFKQITIALPPGADVRSSGLARFAYRGWATGVSEPVRLAVCNIPDTPPPASASPRCSTRAW